MTIHTANLFQEEEFLTITAQPNTDFTIYAEDDDDDYEDDDYDDDDYDGGDDGDYDDDDYDDDDDEE